MKACALAVFAAVLSGCVLPTASWRGEVAWPDEHSARIVGSPMEAGAALAAAGAIRELIRTNPYPHLFDGCSSPEQGLDVVVFTGPTPGLYYVVVHPRFDRCGGPVGRVLDGWDAYAVTPQGEVVAKAPPPAGEAPMNPPPQQAESPQAPPSPAPEPATSPGSPGVEPPSSSEPAPEAAPVSPVRPPADGLVPPGGSPPSGQGGNPREDDSAR